jgi:hypothetical protein
MAEQALEARAGIHTYAGSFLVHYLDAIVYPNLPVSVIIGFGVAVCVLNLGVYGLRAWKARKTMLARLPWS